MVIQWVTGVCDLDISYNGICFTVEYKSVTFYNGYVITSGIYSIYIHDCFG